MPKKDPVSVSKDSTLIKRKINRKKTLTALHSVETLMVLVQDGHVHGIKSRLDMIGADREETLQGRCDMLEYWGFAESCTYELNEASL